MYNIYPFKNLPNAHKSNSQNWSGKHNDCTAKHKIVFSIPGTNGDENCETKHFWSEENESSEGKSSTDN